MKSDRLPCVPPLQRRQQVPQMLRAFRLVLVVPDQEALDHFAAVFELPAYFSREPVAAIPA